MSTDSFIPCACGCGELTAASDARGRPRKYVRGHAARLQPTKRVAVACEWCGTTFDRPEWHVSKVQHQFCNATCAGRWASANGIRRGENNGHYNTITVPCAGCGADVSKAASLIQRRRQRVYCPACVALVHGTAIERGQYTAEFSKDLRRTIRERDAFTCQVCGAVPATAHTLHVHHIDYNRSNCDTMNLISLCRTCHGETNFGFAGWRERLQALMRERFPDATR